MEMSESHYPERRSGIDRRGQQTSPWRFSSLFGKRGFVRRKEDRERHYYVDQYRAHLLLIFLATIALSLVDAFLTLELIACGASELNPVMDYCLQLGPLHFLAAKYILTASGLLFILVHKDYPLLSGRIKGMNVLVCVPVLYALLVFYEMMLLL